jgi:hypothetical protein
MIQAQMEATWVTERYTFICSTPSVLINRGLDHPLWYFYQTENAASKIRPYMIYAVLQLALGKTLMVMIVDRL